MHVHLVRTHNMSVRGIVVHKSESIDIDKGWHQSRIIDVSESQHLELENDDVTYVAPAQNTCSFFTYFDDNFRCRGHRTYERS